MGRTTKPRFAIGVLILSLGLAPLFAAPTMAQADENLHFVAELGDGVGKDIDELDQGLDTWWQRHDTANQAGTYAIVDEPVNEGSAHSLQLAVDAADEQARAVAYYPAAEQPGLDEFFDSGLDYTLYVDNGDLAAATQLVVEVQYGWDGA